VGGEGAIQTLERTPGPIGSNTLTKQSVTVHVRDLERSSRGRFTRWRGLGRGVGVHSTGPARAPGLAVDEPDGRTCAHGRVVRAAVAMLLGAIHKPDIQEGSYGFLGDAARIGRSM
jgi:hypothetical protein